MRGRFGATTRQGRPSPLVMGAARGSGVLPTRRLVVGVRISSAVMMRRLVAEVPAAPIHVVPILHQPIDNVSVGTSVKYVGQPIRLAPSGVGPPSSRRSRPALSAASRADPSRDS